MAHRNDRKAGFASGRVLIGLALVTLALAAVLYFTLRKSPEAKLKEAEAAYQAAHPPYVPPPPPPMIVVPPDVAGPQFDYQAGPRGAPLPPDQKQAPK